MSKISDIIANAIWAVKQNTFNYSQLKSFLSEGLDTCHVKVYRENKDVDLPVYKKNGDACMDVKITRIEYDGRYICHTGLHFELPEDYEMELRPRSSNTEYKVALLNSPGTLDSGYRGELLAIFTPLVEGQEFPYKVGDRAFQLLVRHRERVIWDEVKSLDDLSKSDRGSGGFGHTGK